MSNITIKVTQTHIDSGVRDNCMLCPIATALKQAMLAVYCEVSDAGDIHVDGVRYCADTPAHVNRFITDFDAGRPVEPFDLEICPYECDYTP